MLKSIRNFWRRVTGEKREDARPLPDPIPQLGSPPVTSWRTFSKSHTGEIVLPKDIDDILVDHAVLFSQMKAIVEVVYGLDLFKSTLAYSCFDSTGRIVGITDLYFSFTEKTPKIKIVVCLKTNSVVDHRLVTLEDYHLFPTELFA